MIHIAILIHTDILWYHLVFFESFEDMLSEERSWLNNRLKNTRVTIFNNGTLKWLLFVCNWLCFFFIALDSTVIIWGTYKRINVDGLELVNVNIMHIMLCVVLIDSFLRHIIHLLWLSHDTSLNDLTEYKLRWIIYFLDKIAMTNCINFNTTNPICTL